MLRCHCGCVPRVLDRARGRFWQTHESYHIDWACGVRIPAGLRGSPAASRVAGVWVVLREDRVLENRTAERLGRLMQNENGYDFSQWGGKYHDPDRACWLLEYDGRFVAFAVTFAEGARRLRVEAIWVAAALRRQGAATELLHRVVSGAHHVHRGLDGPLNAENISFHGPLSASGSALAHSWAAKESASGWEAV